jgi:glutamate-1-semialdehyde 2,1-aminomutase
MLTSTSTRSETAFMEAKNLMPGGVNSPVRAAKSLEMTPLVVQKALGSSITDVDDRSFIDYCMSWGALILGHSDPRLVNSISAQASVGTSYGALSIQEIELSKRLVKNIPHLEKVRFVSSGTESTMSALRLARGYTGRDKILKFQGNYHGHHDALLTQAGSYLLEAGQSCSLGVTQKFIQDTLVLPYNDHEALLQIEPIAHEIAAIIFEPVCGNMGVVLPQPPFLKALQDISKKHGIVLIVDEVMTGFRTNFAGATQDYSIDADLYCYGKIIGGGLPSALFGGKANIMDFLAPEGSVFQAGTLSGNPLAMAAGMFVTSALLEPTFYQDLNQKASRLLDPIEKAIQENDYKVTLNRYGSMFTLFLGLEKVETFSDLKELDQERFNRFYKFLFEQGIYLSPSAYEANFISIAHKDEDLDFTRDKIIEALSLF